MRQWRAVQGSEKQVVGEEPPYYLSELLLARTHVVLSCFFATMYCIVLLYSIKLTWRRQCKVVFPAGT